MTTLLEYRAAVMAGLAAGLGASARTVAAHGGRFGLPEIRRYAAQSPGVWVACLGVQDVRRRRCGDIEATVQMVGVVVAVTKPGSPRDAAALLLVGGVLQLLPDADWGLTDVTGPEAIRADNLYSGHVDEAGLALWAVSWRQRVTLGTLDPATLLDFLTFHAAWDVGQTADTAPPEDTVTGLNL